MVEDEEDDVIWFGTFVGSMGNEVDCCDAVLACFRVCLRAVYRSIEGRAALTTGCGGISGTPKAFFTPGALSTEKTNK